MQTEKNKKKDTKNSGYDLILFDFLMIDFKNDDEILKKFITLILLLFCFKGAAYLFFDSHKINIFY